FWKNVSRPPKKGAKTIRVRVPSRQAISHRRRPFSAVTSPSPGRFLGQGKGERHDPLHLQEVDDGHDRRFRLFKRDVLRDGRLLEGFPRPGPLSLKPRQPLTVDVA